MPFSSIQHPRLRALAPARGGQAASPEDFLTFSKNLPAQNSALQHLDPKLIILKIKTNANIHYVIQHLALKSL
jgi:hypothetical protein